ncbi:MAG: hypothetical protein JHC26_10835 [Thermofilum sp.]|jgi:hypothetical protein|uniref:hypothetical protein n=1 Tax=Thermofilum sp. TaxID=1961369 RepID=UPI00258995B1|nr:hypothetical protein [Thermofilum sp.]MCI4409577.1 hypothetical protein [Thermofilum sp.]
MRAFIYFVKDTKDWVVEENSIKVIAKKVFIDGKRVENIAMEDLLIGYVAMIVPRGVKDNYFQWGRPVYEAEEAHIYTFPYLLISQFKEEFGEEKEMAIRVKEVGKE